jgi:hypothetical protein
MTNNTGHKEFSTGNVVQLVQEKEVQIKSKLHMSKLIRFQIFIICVLAILIIKLKRFGKGLSYRAIGGKYRFNKPLEVRIPVCNDDISLYTHC